HAVHTRSLQRAVLFEGLVIQPGRRAQRTMVQVSLTFEGKTEAGEEEAPDTVRGRMEAAARATVGVLDRMLHKGSMMLEGARLIQALDRDVVFAAVQASSGRDTALLT